MKNWPLFWQLWVWFVGMVAGVAAIILLVAPFTLGQFFSEEIGEQLISAQQEFVDSLQQVQNGDRLPFEPSERQGNMRAVRHMLVTTEGEIVLQGGNRGRGGMGGVSRELMEAVQSEVLKMGDDPSARLVRLERDDDLDFAALRPVSIVGRPFVLVSTIQGVYYNNMVNTLFRQIIGVVLVALVLSWIPALVLARHLSRPLVRMEKEMQRIARHEWHEPIVTDRRDEIGKLSMAVDAMRVELLQAEKEQQSLLQHLSHEMKTPVMIIRSYIQSIKDGIFPRGDLSLSLETMDNQTIRLQKRIADLIFFTKLKHWSEQPLKLANFEFDQLIDNVLDGYRHQRQEIAWTIEMEPVKVNGDASRWQIGLENLFENQLRYAKSGILVRLERLVHGNGPEQPETIEAVLTIENDGDPMPDELLGHRFEPFQKGLGGQNGLGLAIAQRIFDLHQAGLEVTNTSDGVRFQIRWMQKAGDQASTYEDKENVHPAE